jgi:hypothetical protein
MATNALSESMKAQPPVPFFDGSAESGMIRRDVSRSKQCVGQAMADLGLWGAM